MGHAEARLQKARTDRLQFVGLQEVRTFGEGSSRAAGYIVYYSSGGEWRKGLYGVRLVVDNSIARERGCTSEPIDAQIMQVRVSLTRT